MARLKSRHEFPPYGWKFYQPQTQWELPGNLSFNGAVLEIIQHRKQRAALLKHLNLSTDYNAVSNELDAFNAARCVASNWNNFVIEERNENGQTVLPPVRLSNSHQGLADVVQLRRNGDIICILPLLQRIAGQFGRPIRLVVAKEYVELLDGVSYVTPVRWDGDWEDPLAAARHFGAENAQAYGFRSGIYYDPKDGHFAEVCWRKLGYEFDVSANLVFDQRSPEREATLAAKVFKTDKPKILINLIGHSSPLHQPDIDFLMGKVIADFGSNCEIIDMKDVWADRLYDVLGLMDRANCLVSSDTATLWLAHGSKIPNVLISRGSPERGNCKLWVLYQDLRRRWHEMSRAIRQSLRK